MKACIGTLCPFVNTHRMVSQYTREFYLPAHARYRKLDASDGAAARVLAKWTLLAEREWPGVAVEEVTEAPSEKVPVGGRMRVRVRLELGSLRPEDVTVELYWGQLDSKGEIANAATAPMKAAGQEQGKYIFEALAVPCLRSGLHGYSVRVLPRQQDLASPMLPGLIAWASGKATVRV
jgi:starch phosphorylase